MKREDLGEYFRHGCELYQAIGYIDQPALELKNIKTGERRTIVIGAPVSLEYHKLSEDMQDERIQKAIEYLKENADDNCSLNFVEELLKILKGEE